MSSRTSSAVAHQSTTAKVVGTVAVLAAVGAVAGLGTLGGFSSSDSVDTEVQAGVVSIRLDAAAGGQSVPFSGGAMLPGDVVQVPFDLRNDGDVPLSSVGFRSVARGGGGGGGGAGRRPPRLPPASAPPPSPPGAGG
ncbi:hypothetical protein, partial [Blastococcus sp. SYSU DS0828]